MSNVAYDSINIRAVVNKWMMDNFENNRKYLQHLQPEFDDQSGLWRVKIITKGINGHSMPLGEMSLDSVGNITKGDHAEITSRINQLLEDHNPKYIYPSDIQGDNYKFLNTDGIKFSETFESKTIDLLLTDPPYGISKPYVCESQIPRRLRPDGRDFIMPKGNFGDWDTEVNPAEWVDAVLPKVGGWFVTFCSHTQIGEYQSILRDHKFSAIGTIVWQKTNPVPFNARYKPVNAWEAIVVGKRPGTKFNGNGVIHNVFKHKSPSPQRRIHTTQKPIGLLTQFVDLFSDAGDMVFDPFSGSGSTLISAVLRGRVGVGCEANKENYQAACGNIKRSLDES